MERVRAAAALIAIPTHAAAHAVAELRLTQGRGGPRAALARLAGTARRKPAADVRDELADVFVPISLAIARAVRQRRERTPLAELPRLGGEPTIIGFRRWRMVRFAQRQRYDRELHDVLDRQVVIPMAPLAGVEVVAAAPQFRQFNRSYDETLRTGRNPLDLGVVVGVEGERLAIAIARAGQAMRAMVVADFLAQANALTLEHGDLLRDFTIHESALNTLLEGVQALEQATAVLTARHATGLTVDELLARIDRDHLINKLAGGPLAFFGPMNTFGVVPKESVRLSADGRLQLAPAMVRLMDRARRRPVRNAQHLRGTDHGCPLLKLRSKRTGLRYDEDGDGSAMSELAHEYVELVRAFYASSPTGA